MKLPLFLARKIYANPDSRHQVSRPAVKTAIAGVAIGLTVMLVTVSVVLGFKHSIRDKVIGFGSHIQVENFLTMQGSDPYPVCMDDSLMGVLRRIPGISQVERYAYMQGILKTDQDFLGITFKGVAQEYDTTFIHQNLVEGVIPHFTDSVGTRCLLLSKMTADKLHLKAGDKVYAYFISSGDVRARVFTVSGIYQTNLTQFDDNICFADLYTVARLNKWTGGQCTGAELRLLDFNELDAVSSQVVKCVNRTVDREANTLMTRTIHEAYPQIFNWLELLDINVWIILALMVCVASFTMISGLLIIILERTQMIGILKALGANDATIRHTFLWFATFIIGRGMVVGNVVGFLLILLQQHFGLVKLDPANYYVSTAPVELDWLFVLLINVATLVVCVLVLIAPSYIISRISPSKSMRYE